MTEHGLTLTIEAGNAAMMTGEDLARALRATADRLESMADGSVFGGPVMDYNGNTVGHYHGSLPPVDDDHCPVCGEPSARGGCPNCGAGS